MKTPEQIKQKIEQIRIEIKQCNLGLWGNVKAGEQIKALQWVLDDKDE